MSKNKTFLHLVTMEMQIDEQWIEFCLKFNDLFMPSCIGYWARGVEQTDKRGWLIYEDCERSYPKGQEPGLKEAKRVWKAGADVEMPKGWYRIDRDTVIRAWVEGVKMFGLKWYEDGCDSTRYDAVIQMALFGKLVYG